MAESPIQSSFIPHDTAVMPSSARYRSSGLYDLLMMIGIVLFVASAVLAIGVFLYQQFLTTESTSKRVQLEKAKAAFEPALIQKLTRLDDRMHAADQLLSNHIAATTFLKVLGDTTLQTVQFTSLDFTVGDTKSIDIKMSGLAQSVNSIALQADLFSKSSVITNPIFGAINRQFDGVHFSVAANVKPELISYSQYVAGLSAGASAALQNTPDAQTPAAPQVSSPFEGGPTKTPPSGVK